MVFEHRGLRALDYFPCRYGTSKLVFRGPKKKLEEPFCAVLGGTETYGRFVETPFPALIERETGIPIVNFGCVNAGTDVFVNDPTITEACRRALVTVVQVTGAHNISNRFYAVHPRRNDRFLRASPLLQAIFREVDFTEFHFTRHMLSNLQALSPERFTVVSEELRAAWVARMTLLLERSEGPTVLLWVGRHRPDDADHAVGLGRDPLLVDRPMIEAVRPFATLVVEVQASDAAFATGLDGKIFAPTDEPAAMEVPGPHFHAEVAAAVGAAITAILQGIAPAADQSFSISSGTAVNRSATSP